MGRKIVEKGFPQVFLFVFFMLPLACATPVFRAGTDKNSIPLFAKEQVGEVQSIAVPSFFNDQHAWSEIAAETASSLTTITIIPSGETESATQNETKDLSSLPPDDRPEFLAKIGSAVRADAVLNGPLSLDSSKTTHTRSPETPQQTETKAAIQAKDLYQLLEDIRIANMRKDLWLWQSRYTARYLEERGRKDDIVGQWKKVDYLSLQYRIEDIRMLPSMTTAIVAWGMELKSLNTGKTNTSSQKLYSEFIFEDGRLKIASVRKAEK